MKSTGSQDRFRGRNLVLRDRELSPGAKMLYTFLDDLAREKGECFPGPGYLTENLNRSKRSVQRYHQELTRAGYLQVKRRRRNCSVYRLYWAGFIRATDGASKTPPDNLGKSGNVTRAIYGASDRRNQVEQYRLIDHREASACADGRSTDSNTNTNRKPPASEQTADITWTQVTLSEYPGAQGLQGSPDVTIARQCLEAGGWSRERICEALGFLHKERRGVPKRSWAWFVVALQNYFGTHKRAAGA